MRHAPLGGSRLACKIIDHRADFLRRPADAGLWRTSRPVSPFSYVGQGRKGKAKFHRKSQRRIFFTEANEGNEGKSTEGLENHCPQTFVAFVTFCLKIFCSRRP